MSDCLFCKIVAGQLSANKIHEDDQVIVFHDIHPKAKVHVLVIPKLHIASLNELTDDHHDIMSHMMLLIPKLAQQLGLQTGFRTIINTGADGGQEVFHLHVHVLGGGRLPGF
jgi:histidine triad (HIT) family protein